MGNSDIIHRLKKGDEALFREIYDLYFEEFLNWGGHHYQLGQDELLDIYQEAMAALYLNAYSGKLEDLTSSLKSYIFAIGKHHIQNYLKKNENIQLYENIFEEELNDQEITPVYKEDGEESEKTKNILKNLGEPCKTILRLAYLQNLPNETIANRLNYKNGDVVKAKKWRCLEAIREQVGKK